MKRYAFFKLLQFAFLGMIYVNNLEAVEDVVAQHELAYSLKFIVRSTAPTFKTGNIKGREC